METLWNNQHTLQQNVAFHNFHSHCLRIRVLSQCGFKLWSEFDPQLWFLLIFLSSTVKWIARWTISSCVSLSSDFDRKTIHAASTVSMYISRLEIFPPPLGGICRTHSPGSLGAMTLYFLYGMELKLMQSINGEQELETWFFSLRGTSKRDSCQQWAIRREVGWQCEDLEKGGENLKS